MAVLTLHGCSLLSPSMMRTGCPCDRFAFTAPVVPPLVFWCEELLRHHTSITSNYHIPQTTTQYLFWLFKTKNCILSRFFYLSWETTALVNLPLRLSSSDILTEFDYFWRLLIIFEHQCYFDCILFQTKWWVSWITTASATFAIILYSNYMCTWR